MSTLNLGRIKPVNKGTWSNSTAYAIDDFVQYTDNGVLSTYIAVATSTNQTPSTSGTENSTYWKFLAKGVADSLSGIGNNKIVTTDGSGNVQALAIGSANQVLRANSSANGYEFATITTGWIKHTYYENSTRFQHSDSAHRVMFSIPFTKSEASSIIIVQGVIPVSQENSDNIGQYGAMDTGGSEPANDSVAHRGVLFIPTESGNHPGGFIYNQRYTGLSAGSHTFYAGYNPRDGGANQPGYINYNHNEQQRNQQTGTTFIIQEVQA